MADTSLNELQEKMILALLERVAPGSSLLNVELLPGSFSNHTHLVEARLSNGKFYKIVVRRYKIFGEYDRGEKARREFKTFELLNQHQVPAPQALLLDETGDILDSPGIVTRFVEGSLMLEAPSDAMGWARKLAKMLAKIHSIPCGKDEQSFLLKGNAEATWFIKHESAPKYMQDYPRGADVWQTLRELYPNIRDAPSALLHLDYWSGNILWHKNEISAVLDWEEAAYGDPAIDVAYARMNMFLMSLPEAADELLRVYESDMGRKVENLGLWELVASVRPMTDPVDWKVTDTPGLNILIKFIEAEKKRAQG